MDAKSHEDKEVKASRSKFSMRAMTDLESFRMAA